jgi:hypothetical protein
MSTNLRKAQNHMQRAKELLNQSQLGFGANGEDPPLKRQRTSQVVAEGQLGFGGPDGVATRKRTREEQAQEPIQCGICLENITPEDGSPLHACHPKYEDIKDAKEHWFHSECLRPWINTGNPCPLCRHPCHRVRAGGKMVGKPKMGKSAMWGKSAMGHLI